MNRRDAMKAAAALTGMLSLPIGLQAKPSVKDRLLAGISSRRLEKALHEFAGVVGSEWVLSSEEDRLAYTDPYAMSDEAPRIPSAAVAPKSVEEIQAILKIANHYKLPLWPISRGKNLGYGGASPALSGTVILDLSRMNRILEVSEKFGYCVVEPGVGFYDLYEYLQKNNIPLCMSSPGNSWGSVMGNALEHGVSAMPYGDHAAQVCGMEVLLADGTLIRTGMGAMTGNSSWHLFKYGFGPSWEGIFKQSNFAIVTRIGLWLMPEPEAGLNMIMMLPNESDLGWAVDVLHQLRLQRMFESHPSIANPIRRLSGSLQRSELSKDKDPIPNAVLAERVAKTGWWVFELQLYGPEALNEVRARVIKDVFAKHTKREFLGGAWKQAGSSKQLLGAPGTGQLNIVNWWGSRGGHLDFSPVCPPTGEHATKQYEMTRRLFEEHGLDYSGGFTLGERHLKHISMILYDRDDADMTQRARQLFSHLVQQSAAAGYGEYRAHVNFMDEVARAYNFNGNALLRLSERVKDALDPNGILAPGKQGIWPTAYRGRIL